MTTGISARDLSTTPDVHTRRAAAVACTLAVAWMLLGGRWASHIGAGPIFLTDVLIAIGVGHWFVSGSLKPAPTTSNNQSSTVHPLLVLFLFWAVIRFVAGGQLSLTALRDAVPYFYAFLALVAGAAVAKAPKAARDRTAKILLWALGIHAAWVFVVALLAPDLPELLPIVSVEQDLHILEIRSDYEGALVGVFAAVLLLRLALGRTRHPLLYLLVITGCWLSIFAVPNRSAFMGAGLATIIVLRTVFAARDLRRGKHMALTFGIFAAFVVAPVLLPQTDVGQRLVGTFGGDPTSAAARNAAGTAGARADTWRFLFGYSQETVPRALFGVGFGPNFMAETQAGQLLVNSSEDSATNPRAPHNYWLNTLLRTGWIGLGLLAGAIVAVFRRVWRARDRIADEPLLLLAATIPVALLVPASLGVVMESPFGAVPFFWCAGALFALTSNLSHRQVADMAPTR